jgi:hypothetical protein
MKRNYKRWDEYSESQKREIRTACVFLELGGVIRSNLPSLVSAIKRILGDEVRKLSSKKKLTLVEIKCLSCLKEISSIDVSVSGLKKLEKLAEKVLADIEMIKVLKPIAEKWWNSAPSFMKFLGFGQLVQQKAVSKFIEFALTWRYTGKGYEAPQGIKEPFSGYDAIINSLMGHPLCKVRMEMEAKAWDKEK